MLSQVVQGEHRTRDPKITAKSGGLCAVCFSGHLSAYPISEEMQEAATPDNLSTEDRTRGPI